MSGASSMAFAYVYCNVPVKPLRRRRRNWICPASRVELPFDVKKIYPEGLIGPAGNVFGRNSCGSRVPFVPRYVAVICKASREVALQRQHPILGISDPEVRIDGEGVGRDALGCDESVRERQWTCRSILNPQALGKR